MKRVAISLLLLLVATAAFAIDTTTPRGTSIGILQSPERYPTGDEAMASAIRKHLREELHKGGFDSFDAGVSIDDLSRGDSSNADYYVEIASSDTNSGAVGGVGVGGGAVAVDISLVIAHVAAEVRLYDGRTLELIHRFELDKSKRSIAPTGVGIGGRNLFAWIAVPFVEMAQFRSAARGVARDAATRITDYVKAD